MHEALVWDIADIAGVDAASAGKFGGKATGLARMRVAGVDVPPAFVISTDAFHVSRGAKELSAQLRGEVERALRRLEAESGRKFAGDPALLVSVRSGAQVSMPGMMDTVLNLGLDAASAHLLAQRAGAGAGSTGGVEFALDTWLRFWAMYTEIVLAGDGDDLREAVADARAAALLGGARADFEALERSVTTALAAQGLEAPLDPRLQLDQAILAVFRSWDSRRARAYREHHRIPDDLGTTVTIQAMVFGNLGARSGTGVAFTRNPNTGERVLYGEFLAGRQGEDLVSGAVTPADLSSGGGLEPAVHEALLAATTRLEHVYKDALDIELTVEDGKLFFLQVRPAKRTAQAAVQIAVDLAGEGVVTQEQALRLVSVEQVNRFLQPTFDAAALAAAKVLATGTGSSPGNAAGVALLDADRAAERAAGGDAVVLLRPTTSPLDIRGMLTACAIVTARGGALSHAAVVSRALDKPCVVGCEAIAIDLQARTFTVDGQTYPEGTALSVDGGTGRVYAGIVPVTTARSGAGPLDRLLRWADERSRAGLWITSRSLADVDAARHAAPAGHGIVGLSDLLVASSTAHAFADALEAVWKGDTSPALQQQLELLAEQALTPLLERLEGAPLDVRLPNLGSSRARLVADAAAMPPQFFLPLGSPAFLHPLLRGIARAAKHAGNTQVTALIAGVTSAAEIAAFARVVAEVTDGGGVRAGATLENLAALEDAASALESVSALWIDSGEIIRTTHGLPPEVPLGDQRAALLPSVHRLVSALVRAAAARSVRVGVTGEGLGNAVLLGSLHEIGCRNFSTTLTSAQGTRLLLGQMAKEVRDG